MFTQRFLSSLMLVMLLQCTRFKECVSADYFINHSNLNCTGQACLTLQQFAANVPKLLKNTTVLRFSTGIHSSPSTRLRVANKKKFSSIAENTDTVITCLDSKVFQFDNVTMVTITNLTFIRCGKAYPNTSSVINAFNSTIYINHCTFINSKGRIINTELCKVTVTDSVFKLSYDSVLSAKLNTTVHITNSIYEWNFSSQFSMVYSYLSKISHKNCTFRNNSANRGIRMIYIRNSTFKLVQCEFASNRANMNIILSGNCTVDISETTFKHNSVKTTGMVSLESSTSTINSSIFLNNTALNKGVLRIYKSKANVYNRLVFQENKAKKGVIYIYQSKVSMILLSKGRSKLHREFIIQENVVKWGVFYVFHSKVKIHQNVVIQGNNATWNAVDFRKSTITFNGNLNFLKNIGCILIEESLTDFNRFSEFSNNKRKKQSSNAKLFKIGGAITSIWSTLQFKGTTRFWRNKSLKVGGAILATESRLYANSNISFSDNSAKDGGALYLDNSNFICKEMCAFFGNRATSKGGAIHAINSVIHIGYEWHTLPQVMNKSTTISFINNTAEHWGGGLSLEANSKLQGPLQPKHYYDVTFNNNIAKKGGAIYVNDDTNTGTCKGKQYSTCFFNIPNFFSSEREGRLKIYSNSGRFTLYGGLLDRCTQRTTLIDILDNDYKTIKKTGIDHLKFISKDPNIQQMITSDPVQTCFCEGETYNCTVKNKMYKIKNGEAFNVQITAVDQVQRPVRAKIYVEHQSTDIRLGIGQQAKDIENRCSDLTLTVYAPNDYAIPTNLTIYADGPCGQKGISHRILLVNILPCQCPIGFQPLNKSEGCSCDCSSQFTHYKTICNQTNQSLIRQDDFWINYTNDSGIIHFIIYPHCPYEYCLSPTSNVSVNLNVPNGIDAQCADGRTGLLCSSCKSDLSLSLGSTLCLPCSKDWPKIFVIILLGAVVSGIALVMVIFILNLTVAIGTLNGLIFYANIVASNHCPLPKSSFFSVFVSWLNLELGLDTCFYKGMDTYSKAWLQFAFPTYLIVVLMMVIILSKYSSRFAKIIGKRNPVATLATLILLSYTKIIRNIIDIFSVAVIHYYDSRKILWLPDANIKYLRGRHIPLFIMATVIIAIGLAYTALLFTWQWLLKAPNHKLLRWIRNTRLNLFMEANLAAYNPKYRYWSGLLLLIRVALYLETAYYNSYEINASILATGLIAACLLFIKMLYGNKVYKKRMIDYLDSCSYLNLLVLSIAQLYNQNNKTGQIIATKISVSVAFLQLLFVTTYHIIITFLEVPCLTRLYLSFRQRLQKESNEFLPHNCQKMELMTQAVTARAIPTSTEVGLSDSKEASVAEYDEEQERVPQSFTTKWTETNSLREPLLQEEL